MTNPHSNFSIDLILLHEDLERAWGSELPYASDKGYPLIFDSMVFWVLFADKEAIAYTGSLTSKNGKYALVGNTYVHEEWRSKGLHSHLLTQRNNSPHLKIIPKITVLNPIEKSNMIHLAKVVSKLGYTHVADYAGVSDIMTLDEYEDIYLPHQEIWRLD